MVCLSGRVPGPKAGTFVDGAHEVAVFSEALNGRVFAAYFDPNQGEKVHPSATLASTRAWLDSVYTSIGVTGAGMSQRTSLTWVVLERR